MLSRLLAPDVFGVVAIVGTFTQACQVILRSGFGAAITQRAELEPAHLTAASFWRYPEQACGAWSASNWRERAQAF